ncbi:polysaccharide deacetylase family protein [Litoribacter populi]|uniref:polysaccharide deacetylase family protein n=1 Tax=Litoribacter populi TaxID=2598460 RepID=UPI00163D8FDC|nr:polysaccharide deacetylase family protein [Litoribacter populi]
MSFRNLLHRFSPLWKSSGALVLMYHKIGSPKTDPWKLAVSERNFDAQMKWLARNCKVISTAEMVENLKTGKVKSRTIALTFDDGYQDNYLLAKPILEKYNLPATFFISDKCLEERTGFWWDELEEIALHSKTLPASFRSSDTFMELGEEATIINGYWRSNQQYYAMDPVNKRSELYLKLWEEFSPLEYKDQESRLSQIKSWAKVTETSVEKCMTREQLKEMGQNDLFTIGAHTHSHPALSSHHYEYQYKEILQNLNYIEASIGRRPKFLAYPSGKYNEDTLNVVKELELDAAFTTIPTLINKRTSAFEMGRFQVMNWEKSEFSKSIKKWETQ